MSVACDDTLTARVVEGLSEPFRKVQLVSCGLGGALVRHSVVPAMSLPAGVPLAKGCYQLSHPTDPLGSDWRLCFPVHP